MLALRWIYEQRTAADADAWQPADGGPATCWHCGLPCPDGAPSQPTRTAIPDTYTEYDVVRANQSPVVCPACASYFTGVKDLVSYSQLLTPTTRRRWERATMRADLEALFATERLDEPCILAIVSSPMKRKHVLPRAPVTTSGARLGVQFDADTIWLAREEWTTIIAPFDALRLLGHSKTEILTGRLHPVALQRDAAAGRLAEVLTLMRQLDVWRGSSQLVLVAHVSPGGDLTGDTLRSGEEIPDNGSRHDNVRTGRGAAARGLGWRQSGVQGEIPARHLEPVAEPGSGTGPYDERSRDVRQSALFDV